MSQHEIVTISVSNGGGVANASKATIKNERGQFVGTGILTPKQKKFVNAFVLNGGDIGGAGDSAGYENYSSAWTVSKLPHVRRAIHEKRDQIINVEIGTLGLFLLKDILSGAEEAPPHVKLAAAKYAIELAGHKAPQPGQDRMSKALADMSPEELRAEAASMRADIERIKLAGEAIKSIEESLDSVQQGEEAQDIEAIALDD